MPLQKPISRSISISYSVRILIFWASRSRFSFSNRARVPRVHCRWPCRQRRPFPWCLHIGWPGRRDSSRVRRWWSRKLRQSPVSPRFHLPKFNPYGVVRMSGKQVHSVSLTRNRPALSSTSFLLNPDQFLQRVLSYLFAFSISTEEPGSHRGAQSVNADTLAMTIASCDL